MSFHLRPLAVVVVSYNSAQDIRACLDSILASGCRALVVDNGSSDATLHILATEYPPVNVFTNPANGYARAANLGFAHSDSELVIVCNADIVFPDGSMRRLFEYLASHEDIGVLGPQQVYPDGSWQRSWGVTTGLGEAVLELLGFTTLYNAVRTVLWPFRLNQRAVNVGYVDGAVMIIRRSAFNAVEGFDATFPFSAEETDFCIRVRRAGWKIVSLPSVRVTHRRGGSSALLGWSTGRQAAAMLDGTDRLLRKYHGPLYSATYFAIKYVFNAYMTLLCRVCSRMIPGSLRARLQQKSRLHHSYCLQLCALAELRRNGYAMLWPG